MSFQEKKRKEKYYSYNFKLLFKLCRCIHLTSILLYSNALCYYDIVLLVGYTAVPNSKYSQAIKILGVATRKLGRKTQRSTKIIN